MNEHERPTIDLELDGERFCGGCNDWAPSYDVHLCPACGEHFCIEHLPAAQHDCAGPGTEAA